MKPSPQRLQEVCQIIQGGRHGKSGSDFVSQGFPAYGAGGLNGYLEDFEFERPAVVLSSIGARCGKCFYVDGRWSSLANTQVILPDPVKCDPKFLWFQLNDETRWPRSGTAQPFIKPSDVKAHEVFLPPLSEQRRIASILDQADALRAKRREAMEQLGSFPRSLFMEMFGSPTSNPKEWREKRLIEVCSPKQWPTITTNQLMERGFPVFGANGLIGYFDQYNHEEETVLITCRGATCGTINVSPPKCYVTGNSMALDDPDLSTVTKEYLAETLRIRGLADVISGTAQPQITRQGLTSVKLPVPPMELQKRFSALIRQAHVTREEHVRSMAELNDLFISLRHRAFSGQLS